MVSKRQRLRAGRIEPKSEVDTAVVAGRAREAA